METFIAVSPHGIGGYYGVGESIEVAKARLKEQGGNLVRYVVFKLPPGATSPFVNDFGSVMWTWADDADTTGTTEVVFKRGVQLATA